MDLIGIVRLGDENFEFPIMEGTEAERAIDLRTLRSKTGHIALMKVTEIQDLAKAVSLLLMERRES